jgi:hypothetical protein
MHTPPKDPSDLSPAFTWDHLKAVGQIAFDAARWVAEHVVPNDSACCTGLRRWDHIRSEITKAAAYKYPEWLSVPEPGALFTFAMSSRPVRFFRGDDEDPVPVKYANPTLFETVQTETEFIYRYIIVVDGSSVFPTAVLFAALNNAGEIAYSWTILINTSGEASGGASAPVAPIVAPKAPVALPPLVIQSVAEADEAERAETVRKEREMREQKERELADLLAKQRTPDTKGA